MSLTNSLNHYKDIFISLNENINQTELDNKIQLLQELNENFNSGLTFFIIIDMSNSSVKYVSPNFKKLTGGSHEKLLQEGLPYYLSLIHKDDLNNWTLLLEELMQFTLSIKHDNNLSYTYNYRFKSSTGEFLNLCENQMPFIYDSMGKPLVSFGSFSVLQNRGLIPMKSECAQLNSDGVYETIFSKTYSNATFSSLTTMEKTIIKLIASGKSSKEIAETNFTSIKTVENHRSNICKKLNLKKETNSLLNFSLEHKEIILNL